MTVAAGCAAAVLSYAIARCAEVALSSSRSVAVAAAAVALATSTALALLAAVFSAIVTHRHPF